MTERKYGTRAERFAIRREYLCGSDAAAAEKPHWGTAPEIAPKSGPH